MKTFSPPRDSVQSEIARDILRTETVRGVLKEEQNKLNELKTRFDLTLASQRKEWAEEEEQAIRRINELRIEVEKLEERQKVAHFPIEPAERRAYDLLEQAKATNSLADKYKEKMARMEQSLYERLDKLSDRDEDLDAREKIVKSMERGAEEQRSKVRQLSEVLSKEWEKFYNENKSKEKEFERERHLIELHKKDLDKREDVLLDGQEKLRDDQLHLSSQRMSLAAAFEELRIKKTHEK